MLEMASDVEDSGTSLIADAVRITLQEISNDMGTVAWYDWPLGINQEAQVQTKKLWLLETFRLFPNSRELFREAIEFVVLRAKALMSRKNLALD